MPEFWWRHNPSKYLFLRFIAYVLNNLALSSSMVQVFVLENIFKIDGCYKSFQEIIENKFSQQWLPSRSHSNIFQCGDFLEDVNFYDFSIMFNIISFACSYETCEKLGVAEKAAEDSERGRKVIESRYCTLLEIVTVLSLE